MFSVLVNRCPLLLLHLTICTSFFGNSLVHVVTYYNITHKDKLKGQFRTISIRISLSKGCWTKTDQFVNFNFINFVERLYHFIVNLNSLYAKTENWLLATETTCSCKTLSYLLVFIVVTQPHTIFRASVRINYRYILKLNKLTWLTNHRRREKELMIIFFPLFFVFALVLSSCWIWLKHKYFLA